MDEDDETKQRWPRGQRFQLSDSGRRAAGEYRAAIVAARGEGGRRSFDAARAAWAAGLALESDDGLYLGALAAGAKSIAELADALDECGPQRSEVAATLDRLVKLKLIAPVVPPPRAPPVLPRRW